MPSSPQELPPDAKSQGICLGTFVGFIRFKPLVIITEGRDVYFIRLIKRLKSSQGGSMLYEQLILPRLQHAETQIGIQVATLKLRRKK